MRWDRRFLRVGGADFESIRVRVKSNLLSSAGLAGTERTSPNSNGASSPQLSARSGSTRPVNSYCASSRSRIQFRAHSTAGREFERNLFYDSRHNVISLRSGTLAPSLERLALLFETQINRPNSLMLSLGLTGGSVEGGHTVGNDVVRTLIASIDGHAGVEFGRVIQGANLQDDCGHTRRPRNDVRTALAAEIAHHG